MPDISFRTFIYSAAAVALGGVAVILAGRFVPAGSSPDASAPVAFTAATALAQADHGSTFAQAQTSGWKSLLPAKQEADSDAAQPAQAVATQRTRASDVGGYAEKPASSGVAAGAVVADYRAAASEPVIRVQADAIEVTVPVHPVSGRQAMVPVALALSADPEGLPDAVREDARKIALDFMEDVADVAATADSFSNADYYNRWQSAAYLADLQFKMRYGRVAYVRMNQAQALTEALGLR